MYRFIFYIKVTNSGLGEANNSKNKILGRWKYFENIKVFLDSCNIQMKDREVMRSTATGYALNPADAR